MPMPSATPSDLDIRVWACEQASSTGLMGTQADYEELASRLARFVQTGSFDLQPDNAAPAVPKTWNGP